LPFVVNTLESIEAGKGSEEHIAILVEHLKYLNYAFCALAPGAMGPVEGLLKHFEEELLEHIIKGRCPLRNKPCPDLSSTT